MSFGYTCDVFNGLSCIRGDRTYRNIKYSSVNINTIISYQITRQVEVGFDLYHFSSSYSYYFIIIDMAMTSLS